MSDVISWQDAVGTQTEKSAPSPETAGTLSWDQANSGADEIAKSAMDWASPGTQAFNVLKDTGGRLGKGTVAALDMMLGLPGMALGVGGDIGARTAAVLSGESARTARTAGAIAKEQVPAQIEQWLGMSKGGLTAPLQTIMKVAGGVEPYDQSSVGEAIDAFASHVERAGIAKAEDVKSYVDTAMLAGLARGGDATAKALLEKKTASGK